MVFYHLKGNSLCVCVCVRARTRVCVCVFFSFFYRTPLKDGIVSDTEQVQNRYEISMQGKGGCREATVLPGSIAEMNYCSHESET